MATHLAPATGPARGDTLARLRDLITEHFGIDGQEIDADRSIADAGLDSLALAELLFDVEDRFGVTFAEQRDDVGTLRGLAALIDEMTAGKVPAEAGT